ncbi:MAG: diguanylate cyclase, partial [Epsilonproteobacteria bacterium]|nr:diguanylate cyclase [Campylobacterota bacterium]
ALFPKETSNMIYDRLINTDAVISIFKNAYKAKGEEKDHIRHELYARLKDTYEYLKFYNIQQLHFHLPNNESFLRFHRPSKYGDNLTLVRETVAYTNRTLKPTEGFEEGKIFKGYRFVYPLFDEQKNHIGSVEISHSLKAFKDYYQDSFKHISFDIVLNKEVVLKKVFKNELENYEVFEINSMFMYQKEFGIDERIRKVAKLIDDQEELRERMNSFEDFSLAIKHEDHCGVLNFITIKNVVTGINVAYAITLAKSDYLTHFYETFFYQQILLCLLSIFITIGAYYIYNFLYRASREKHLARLENIRLQESAMHDGLTSLCNRAHLEEHLHERIKSFENDPKPFSVIMFDIDNFKHINDSYGDDIGDNALVYLSSLVQSKIRKNDILARWGGEEFMIALEGDIKAAAQVAEQLRSNIEKMTHLQTDLPDSHAASVLRSLRKTLLFKLFLNWQMIDYAELNMPDAIVYAPSEI